MKDIFIFGTCRVCYPCHEAIQFVRSLREYHSREYKIGEDTRIYTEPVNYTTKLADILDSILYMKGKLYQHLDPRTDMTLQSIFFRGHKSVEDMIPPGTHPSGSKEPIRWSKVILEVPSIKQLLFRTSGYGTDFHLRNLPWKLHTGYEHNGIEFEQEDFTSKVMTKEECFETLNKIHGEIDRCEVLMIGPYRSRLVPTAVNREREGTQDILKEYCSAREGFHYFDMSAAIAEAEGEGLELDQTHFTEKGMAVLSEVMLRFCVA